MESHQERHPNSCAHSCGGTILLQAVVWSSVQVCHAGNDDAPDTFAFKTIVHFRHKSPEEVGARHRGGDRADRVLFFISTIAAVNYSCVNT